jgi:hypothetical protein
METGGRGRKHTSLSPAEETVEEPTTMVSLEVAPIGFCGDYYTWILV